MVKKRGSKNKGKAHDRKTDQVVIEEGNVQKESKGWRQTVHWLALLPVVLGRRFLAYLLYPIDVFFSINLKMELCIYQRVAGRMPWFLEEMVKFKMTKQHEAEKKLMENEKELKKLEIMNKELMDKIEDLTNQTEKEKNVLEERIAMMETRNKEEKKKWQEKLQSNEADYEELSRVLSRISEEKRSVEAEKQDALRRLSELVSVRLRDNNPNIVDLNDQCRPTKLAEMFSELYDNEWTSAYDVLERRFTEEQTLVVLLDTVMIAYCFCKEMIDTSWQVLTYWFCDEEIQGYEQTMKWLKDSRKSSIQGKALDVEKDFTEKMAAMCGNVELSVCLSEVEVTTYLKKCIELCLLMVATDPPVVMECPGWIDYSMLQAIEVETIVEAPVKLNNKPEGKLQSHPLDDKGGEVKDTSLLESRPAADVNEIEPVVENDMKSYSAYAECHRPTDTIDDIKPIKDKFGGEKQLSSTTDYRNLGCGENNLSVEQELYFQQQQQTTYSGETNVYTNEKDDTRDKVVDDTKYKDKDSIKDKDREMVKDADENDTKENDKEDTKDKDGHDILDKNKDIINDKDHTKDDDKDDSNVKAENSANEKDEEEKKDKNIENINFEDEDHTKDHGKYDIIDTDVEFVKDKDEDGTKDKNEGDKKRIHENSSKNKDDNIAEDHDKADTQNTNGEYISDGEYTTKEKDKDETNAKGEQDKEEFKKNEDDKNKDGEKEKGKSCAKDTYICGTKDSYNDRVQDENDTKDTDTDDAKHKGEHDIKDKNQDAMIENDKDDKKDRNEDDSNGKDRNSVKDSDESFAKDKNEENTKDKDGHNINNEDEDHTKEKDKDDTKHDLGFNTIDRDGGCVKDEDGTNEMDESSTKVKDREHVNEKGEYNTKENDKNEFNEKENKDGDNIKDKDGHNINNKDEDHTKEKYKDDAKHDWAFDTNDRDGGYVKDEDGANEMCESSTKVKDREQGEKDEYHSKEHDLDEANDKGTYDTKDKDGETEKDGEDTKSKTEIYEKENGEGRAKDKDKDGTKEEMKHSTTVVDEASKFEHNPSKERKLYPKELFKEYTCRGKYLDYVVWPVLYLHKDGPLLCKGIAQGTKTQYTEEDEECWTWMKHK